MVRGEDLMLTSIITAIVLAALALWVLTQFPKIDPTLVKIVRVIVIVVTVLYVLQFFGGPRLMR